MAATKKPPTMSALKWDVREVTKKLKKLGVMPPPPKGKPAMKDIMKPGKFYAMPRSYEEVDAYLGQLRRVLDGQSSKWTADAFLHTVLAAAMKAAPEDQRLERPHGHVAAKPVINNRGYLGAALLAAEHVRALVPEAERKAFNRLEELGRRVLAGKEMTSEDEAVLNREAPHVWQPSGAHSRNFTAVSPVLRIAQGVAFEAEEAEANNVGGKGAREACAQAAQVLAKPRPFLEALDALILLEDAKLQFSKVSEKPSAELVASCWRGAEKGKGSHWLVKLANGRFALLWKVKGKWRLVEGSREDAIASVPDAHLKDAVAAMAASSGR